MSWLDIVAGSAILLSCTAIFASFAYFLYNRKDLASGKPLLLFAALILALGLTPLAPVFASWYSLKWLPIGLKFMVAILSATVAILLIKILPNTLKIPNPLHLEAEVQERQDAFWELKLKEVSLRESKETLEKAYQELETRVESRTEELESRTHELARQTSVLRRIIDSIPDLIILKDTDGFYLGSNKAFEKFTGLPESEQIGKTDYELFDNDTALSFRTADRHILDTGQTLSDEQWVTYPDGQKALLSTVKTPFYGQEGEVLGLVGISRDITERVAAETSLRQAAVVFESTREGVIITDTEKRILMVNRAFSQVLGYDEKEVEGKTLAMLHSARHDQIFFKRMWTEINSSNYWQGEIWYLRKNGEELPILLSISTVMDHQGKATQYVCVFTDISKLKRTEAELEFLAHHDPLTRLPNRRLLLSHIRQEMEAIKREGGMLALLMLDLDRFKDVNDSFGHATGDELLQKVAERLNGRLRSVDTLTRLGGDEFTILLHGITNKEDAARVANEVVTALGEPWFLSNGYEVRIGSSVGISLYPDDNCTTAEEMLQQADTALYQAKEEGRGRFKYFSEDLTVAARERISLEAALRRAITNNELRVYYQPQMDIVTGMLIGAEALVRWQHPEEGIILPDRYISVAEETGLIGAIGDWVLNETCRQGQQWIDAGLKPVTLAVNLSPHQFHHKDISKYVMQVLKETGFPPQHLELELTESVLVKREHDAVAKLNLLRDIGIRLAIDDFGTGYSSLAYLKRFPLDLLKIDRSFVQDIPHDRDDVEIATAIIGIGHTLGFKVLAEGVETEEQLAFLKEQGCDYYQGYLKNMPLVAEEFEKLLSPVNQQTGGKSTKKQKSSTHIASPGLS